MSLLVWTLRKAAGKKNLLKFISEINHLNHQERLRVAGGCSCDTFSGSVQQQDVTWTVSLALIWQVELSSWLFCQQWQRQRRQIKSKNNDSWKIHQRVGKVGVCRKFKETHTSFCRALQHRWTLGKSCRVKSFSKSRHRYQQQLASDSVSLMELYKKSRVVTDALTLHVQWSLSQSLCSVSV